MRKYGEEKYQIAVIHGGPGAPGSMGTLAQEISKRYGVIEPYQSKDSIEGQLSELKTILENEKDCIFPITLIGHSYGAWLSYLFAAKYPKLVKKLILIGCGSFESHYVNSMNQKRINRLSVDENKRISTLFQQLVDKNNINNKSILKEFGELMSKADSYDPITLENEIVDFQIDVFNHCMKEINQLRDSKELLNRGRDIQCPVIAIHGEYDSHAYQGVQEPLSRIINQFQFHLLDHCGHTPWNERLAKEKFYRILFRELDN